MSLNVSNSSELEDARRAIMSYYTESTAEQLEPDKTQTELTVDEVNTDAASDAIDTLETKADEHEEMLTTRKRTVTRNVKKEV